MNFPSNPKAFELEAELFKTSTKFKIGAVAIFGITAVLYALFW